MQWFGIASYTTAAIVYGAIAAILIVSHPGGQRASLLAAAASVSSLWAGGLAVLLVAGRLSLFTIVTLDAVHMLVWMICVLSWLGLRLIKQLLITMTAIAGAWGVLASSSVLPLDDRDWLAFLSLFAMALLGLLAVEQVLRTSGREYRKWLRLFVAAAGGVFVINLVVYSQATLVNGLSQLLWDTRGFANAALAPLAVVAIKQQFEWERELFVSRHVVLYTATLLGVGAYLLTMVLVALVLRAFGGEWSLLLQLTFFAAAIAALVFVLFSTSIKARFKVFLVKHFYRNKYDYRQEWMRLTQILGRTGDLKLLAMNALDGMSRIVGARTGDLWLAGESGGYEWVASLDDKRLSSEQRYDAGHPVVEFLQSNGWVIDSDEYEADPDRYGRCFGGPEDRLLPQSTLVVPLDQQGFLQGFVLLGKPAGLGALNFEDHDILKAAGRQIAVVLAQAVAQEKLTEVRQFEAMNKLSAFLMHDLKNVVAQQELVVANAQRFRDKPEFIDDAMTTIRSGVERMKKVLEQLRSATQAEGRQGRVDVSKIVMEVRSQCADREPVPQTELSGKAVFAAIDRDKLLNVLTHLVRNSQEATAADGSIRISLVNGDDRLSISVSDTGCGMDADFIRNRLFRPFDSTKGAKGMGIGAYQVRHIVHDAGGEIDVVSEPGAGTTFRLSLPVAGA